MKKRLAGPIAAILGAAVACSTAPEPTADDTGEAPPRATAAALAAAPATAGSVRVWPAARWVAADWSELPGWPQDALLFAWPALLRSCERAAGDWAAPCESARALRDADEARVRGWLHAWLQPWRVESPDGRADGLATGYFEPLIDASRLPRPGFQVPIHGVPADLDRRRPWYTRAQVDSDPAARAALRGREWAFVADPLDALVLQVQGSGRLLLTEADGSRRLVRAAFAAHNDQPYKSIGRWLVDHGAFTLEQASWPAIKAWARSHPERIREMLNANPRYVFFREEPLADPTTGPVGAQGVPLAPGRSIAVDKSAVPLGTPVWIDTTEPMLAAANGAVSLAATRPLQRLVVAQDTGGAITGAVRADYFWGWGEGAEDRAGRMKQPLRLWALWPRAATPDR